MIMFVLRKIPVVVFVVAVLVMYEALGASHGQLKERGNICSCGWDSLNIKLIHLNVPDIPMFC